MERMLTNEAVKRADQVLDALEDLTLGDLKAKSAKGTAGSAAGAATGAADHAVNATGYGDLILYGSLAVVVIGGLWLAWRYRDELSIALMGGRTRSAK